MPNKQWIAIACGFVLALSSCQTSEAPADIGAASNVTAPGAAVGQGGEAASAVAGSVGEVTAEPEDAQAQLMVESGTAQLPEQTPIVEKERPQPAQGIQRVVSLDDAIAAVPFEIRQPADLPDNAAMQIVQLVEPPEGQASASLPAVRMIFGVDPQGVIVLMESPATGETADGDPTTIGSFEGWLQQSDNLIIMTWEDGTVRYELRGSGIDMDTLTRVAVSLGPVGTE